MSAKSGVDRSTSPFIEHEEEGGSTSKAREKGEDEEEKEKEEEVMFPHPYQYELEHLAYPEWELAPQEVQAYGVLEKTPVTWVGTAEALDALVEKLRGERAVAIDLEAHSLRSYEGFTCLMQVSTRAEDFLVDTLALRGRLHVLNTVFTDPCVLKVLHGCDWDVLWLQRDFALYLVNCFDTGQAARVLGLPSFALKYLLQLYCNVEADKRYQLADWRIRPLPPEMFDYARGDTHYLLYIYDRMKADLLARAGGAPTLLAEVLDRSRNICLSCYRPTPPPTAAAARRILLRDRSGNGASSSSSSGHRSFTRLQTAVLEELYRWRDTVARREDESVRYILPNHMLLRVAELLPTSLPELLKTCNPVPVVFHTNGADIVDIIRRTKKQQDALTAHLPVKVLPQMPDHPTHTVFSEADDNDSGNGSATKDKSTLTTATATATDTTTTTATKTSASGNGNDDNNGGGGGGDDDDEVLTTDQLYKLAGWEEKTDERNDIAMSNSSHTKTDAQAVKSSSLFDDSSDDDDDDAIINSGGNSSASAAASVIEFPPLTATFQEKPKKDKEENAGEEDEEEGASTVTTIPKTMEEIYKLSNANRKRNKEKRKLKEESGKLHSNADDSSDNEEPDQKAPNTAKPTVEDKHEFMKKIGWVESTDADTTTTAIAAAAAAAAATEHQQPQSQTATQKQGIRIERRKPGIASTKKQQQQQQQQKAFTSYDYNKINSLSVRSSFGMSGSGKGKQQQQLQQQHSQQQGKKKEKVPTGPKQPNFGGQQKQPHTSKFQRGAVSQSFGGLGTTAAPAKPAWKK